MVSRPWLVPCYRSGDFSADQTQISAVCGSSFFGSSFVGGRTRSTGHGWVLRHRCLTRVVDCVTMQPSNTDGTPPACSDQPVSAHSNRIVIVWPVSLPAGLHANIPRRPRAELRIDVMPRPTRPRCATPAADVPRMAELLGTLRWLRAPRRCSKTDRRMATALPHGRPGRPVRGIFGSALPRI